MVLPQTQVPPERRRVLMAKSYQICCPKCNNRQNFYRYGKDKHGNQKYLCRVCGHQFAPDAPAAAGPEECACVPIRSALSAGRPCSSTTTTNITQITAAVTKDAIIPSSCQKQPPSQRLPCPSCREKPISSECAIRCIPF